MKIQKKYKSTEMNKKSENGGHKLNHGLMMVICCLTPILIIAGLPLLGIKGGSYIWLIYLLMPLMHLGMMISMKKGKQEDS